MRVILDTKDMMNLLLYAFALLCLILTFIQTDKLNRTQTRYDMLEKRLESRGHQEQIAQQNTKDIKYE